MDVIKDLEELINFKDKLKIQNNSLNNLLIITVFQFGKKGF